METNIKFEKFTANDFSLYFELVNNEKVMEMITERALEKDEAAVEFEKIIKNNNVDKNCGNFKIIDTITNRFLGLAKLQIQHEYGKEAELGYMILPPHWGKGIGSKTATQLIAKAKKDTQLEKLFAIIDPKNSPSRKILVNNGFISKELRDFDGLPGEILELTLM